MNKIETPYFLFEKKILEEELSKINQSALYYWPNLEVAYSVKTNNFPPLLKFLFDKGISSEVVSSDEYDLVTLCGFDKNKIICNGPIKSKRWVYAILEAGVRINIDSKIELFYVAQFAEKNPERLIKVGLRINTAIESYSLGETNSVDADSRFGFSNETDELSSAIEYLNDIPNVKIEGLHLHVSTRTRGLNIYQYLVELFLKIVGDFVLSDISYIDIGGGFFGGIEDSRNWKSYFEAIATKLNEGGFTSNNLKIIIEPGVSLIAGCFSYVTSVTDIKFMPRNKFILLDGSRIHIDPFFHKESYFYEILKKDITDSLDLVERQTLVGFTCLEKDRFFTLSNEKSLKVGDILVFKKVGAYTLSLSPLFISFFPAVYTIDEDENLFCLREKWTAKEFIQLITI